MNEFFDFPQTGRMVYERVFLDMGAPLLFVCKGADNKRYLGVCCQVEHKQKKWLLAETNLDTIIQMLQDKITIRDAFLRVNKQKYTIIKETDCEPRIIENDLEDWDADNSIYLPDAGEYMEAEPGEFEEDIIWFTSDSRIKRMMSYAGMLQNSVSRNFEYNINISTKSQANRKYNIKLERPIICKPVKDAERSIIDNRYSPYAA